MKNISHAATILRVTDMETSLKFYPNILGFTATYIHEDPASYAELRLNDTSIHLSLNKKSMPAGPAIYFFIHDVDAVWRSIRENYEGEMTEPVLWDYNMRDFEVQDPSGNRLIFGKHVDQG